MINIKLNGYKIFISQDVLNSIRSYRQTHKGHKESGGILLGQIVSKNVYIIKISHPCNLDSSGRTTFRRNREKAQIIIDHEFANSGGKTIYLGEWHTHPESKPNPSSTDIKMIEDQLEKNKLNVPFVLILIQGINKIFLGMIGIERGKMITTHF